MSKRTRRKHKRPQHRPPAAVKALAARGEPEGVVLQIARVVCLVGLPALLLVSPSLFYMRGANLSSENSLFQWNCVEALATVVATLWLAAVALGQVPRARVHRLDVALVGFFAVALVSSLLVPHRFDPARRLTEMLAVGVFFIAVKNLFTNERWQRLLVRVMMSMLAIFAVIGVVHYLWYVLGIRAPNVRGQVIRFIAMSIDPNFAPWEKDFGVRATSVEGNPNFLASSLLVLVPIGLAWLVMRKRPRMARGPLAGAIIWALVTAVLLGIAADAHQRLNRIDRQAQELLASRPAGQVDRDALVQRHERARKNLRAFTDLTAAWTLAGTAALVATVWLWPFAGTAIAVVLGFALLLFTNSWAGYSGMIVALLVVALLVVVKKPARFRPRRAVALGTACACALVGFLVIKYASGSYIIPPTAERTGARSRQILWDTVPRMVRARPVLGFGADNFFAYANKYMAQVLPGPSHFERVMVPNLKALTRIVLDQGVQRITLLPSDDVDPGTVSLLTNGRRLVMQKHALVFINNPQFITRNPGRTHSEYMSMLVETGVVGLVLFVAIFVLFFTGTLGAWRRGEDSWRSVVSLGSCAAIAGVAVMQTIDFPFRLPWASCLIVSALALPLAWQRGWNVPLRPRLPAGVRAVLALLVVAAGVYLLVTDWHQVRTLQLTKAAEREAGQRGFPTPDVVADYERLAARRARDHNVYFRLPEMLLYLGELRGTADHLAALERIQPYHEKVQYLWGQFYRKRGQVGDVDRAIAHYRRALELEPRYMKARVTLIDTLVEAARLDEARAAIAEAWRWEPESEMRLQMAQRGSSQVKFEGGLPVIQAEDMYWPWVMNAEATIHALEGDFEAAAKRWHQTAQRWSDERVRLGEVDQGPYGIYPDPPLFVLNPGILAQTTPDQVRADPARWARRFYGVADYERFKRLDDEYKASFKWAGVVPGPHGGPITREEAARHARDVLEQLVAEFGENSLVTDGNWGRSYHNRRGLLALIIGPLDDAIAEFEQGARGDGGDVCRANLVAVQHLGPDGRLMFSLIDERAYNDIGFRLDRLVKARSDGLLTPEQYAAALSANFGRTYAHYLPVALTTVRALAAAGRRNQAVEGLRLLGQMYPNEPRIQQLRSQLGF